MRFLLLNWKDIKNPKSGGAEVVTHNYAKFLCKSGHKVILVCPAFPNCQKEEVIDDVLIKRLGFRTNFNQKLIYLLAFFYYQKYLKGKVDLIIDQIHWIPFFTPLYVREKKIAFIHEVAKDIWQKQFGNIKGLIGKTCEPFLFLPYKKINFLTVSETTKQGLIDFHLPAKSISVIHNGTNLKPLTKLPTKENMPTFISLGRISRVKNQMDLILAMKIIKKIFPNFQLWLVGNIDDKKYYQQLKYLTKQLSLEKSIKFFGFVDETKKIDLLSRSHLLLHTSFTEGWGLVIIEACALATPAVAYRVSGLSESIVHGQTGLLCINNKPEEVAALSLELLENEKKYNLMQKKCLKWAAKFTWERSYRSFGKFIERVMSN